MLVPRPNVRGILEIIVCRILTLMWSFEPLFFAFRDLLCRIQKWRLPHEPGMIFRFCKSGHVLSGT